jgi:hypothetical protein
MTGKSLVQDKKLVVLVVVTTCSRKFSIWDKTETQSATTSESERNGTTTTQTFRGQAFVPIVEGDPTP